MITVLNLKHGNEEVTLRGHAEEGPGPSLGALLTLKSQEEGPDQASCRENKRAPHHRG